MRHGLHFAPDTLSSHLPRDLHGAEHFSPILTDKLTVIGKSAMAMVKLKG